MENKNIGGGNWAELPIKVASDHTYGSPEYHNWLLRQITGRPEPLPGETSEIYKSKTDNKRTSGKIPNRRNMPDIFYQG